jgi:hypothetical protein
MENKLERQNGCIVNSVACDFGSIILVKGFHLTNYYLIVVGDIVLTVVVVIIIAVVSLSLLSVPVIITPVVSLLSRCYYYLFLFLSLDSYRCHMK